MASNINPNNIDTTYPVAGQDNDSQGFRDNFPFPAWYLALALNQNFQIDWISPNQAGYLDCCRQSLLN